MLQSFEQKLKQFTRSSGHYDTLKSHSETQKLYRSKVEDILNSQIVNSKSTVQYSKYVLDQARKLQETRQLLNNYSLQSRIFIPKNMEKAVHHLQNKVVHELIEQKEKEYLLVLLKKHNPDLLHNSGNADQLVAEASQCHLIDMSGFEMSNELVRSLNPEHKQLKTSQWVLDYLDEAEHRYKNISHKVGRYDSQRLKESFHDRAYQDKLQAELKDNFELTLEKRDVERKTADILVTLEDKNKKIQELQQAIRTEKQRKQELIEEKLKIEKLGREIVEQMKSHGL